MASLAQRCARVRRSVVWLAHGSVAAWATLLGTAVAVETVSVVERGSLILPGEVGAAEPVPLVGLSGISWMGGDRYVAVMDNSRHLLTFRLKLSPAGQPLEASDCRLMKVCESHDYEDVVWLPPVPHASGDSHARAEADGRVLVCEEDSPGILAFELRTGERITSLGIPEIFRARRANRGFEALALDPGGRHVWTANEEALPADGPAASAGGTNVVRLTRIPLGRPDGTARRESRQHAYAVDPPHAFVRMFEGDALSGLVALVPIAPDRLLVLERSGGPGLPPFSNRLYDVSLDGARDVASLPAGLAEHASLWLKKTLVWKDQLGVNLEGLCLGPDLRAGGRSLIGIADNGGLGTPSQIVGFQLTTSP